MSESMKGCLWLTSGGRIVLDNHNNETYTEPYDTKLMTVEDLGKGVSAKYLIMKLFKKGV